MEAELVTGQHFDDHVLVRVLGVDTQGMHRAQFRSKPCEEFQPGIGGKLAHGPQKMLVGDARGRQLFLKKNGLGQPAVFVGVEHPGGHRNAHGVVEKIRLCGAIALGFGKSQSNEILAQFADLVDFGNKGSFANHEFQLGKDIAFLVPEKMLKAGGFPRPLFQQRDCLLFVKKRGAPENGPCRLRSHAQWRFSLVQEVAGDINKSGEHGCISMLEWSFVVPAPHSWQGDIRYIRVLRKIGYAYIPVDPLELARDFATDEKWNIKPELATVSFGAVLKINEYGAVLVTDQDVAAGDAEMVDGMAQQHVPPDALQGLEKGWVQGASVGVEVFGHRAGVVGDQLHDQGVAAAARLVDAVKRHEMPGHIRRDMGHESALVVEFVAQHVHDPVFFPRDHGRVRELPFVSAMLGQDLGAARGVALDGVDSAPTADGGNFRVECDHMVALVCNEASCPEDNMKFKNFLVCNSMENVSEA